MTIRNPILEPLVDGSSPDFVIGRASDALRTAATAHDIDEGGGRITIHRGEVLEFSSRDKGSEFHTEFFSTAYASSMEPEWAARLRKKLKEKRWSVPRLAREMGKADDEAFADLLYRYRRGEVENPRGETMALIAKALEMTEQELRFGYDTEVAQVDLSDSTDTPSQQLKGIVREFEARSGMGGGGLSDREVMHNGHYSDPLKPEGWLFPASFLRNELRAPASRIVVLETQGDSMSPTITSGERVIVDTDHQRPTPDGIYALRDRFGSIQVKRLHVLRGRSKEPRIKIISDNPHHPTEEVGPDEIEIVGRVVCALRRF